MVQKASKGLTDGTGAAADGIECVVTHIQGEKKYIMGEVALMGVKKKEKFANKNRFFAALRYLVLHSNKMISYLFH